MHQQLKTEQSVLPTKRSILNHKIESYIIKSISEQTPHYHALTQQQSPEIIISKQSGQNKLFPAITRKGRIGLPPATKQQPLFKMKQPKMLSVLHYQSQKLMHAARAKNEEQHLYKGNKKFHIQTVKLNHQSLQKLERRGRYSLPSLIAKQLKMNDVIQQKLDNQPSTLRKQLSVLARQKQPKRKQFYLQLEQPQTLSGWNSHEQQFDGLH